MKKLMENWNDFLNEEEPVENDKLKLFREALNEELVTAGHEALTEEYIDYALHEIFGIGSSKKDKSKNWFDTPGDEEAFKGFFKGFTTNNQRLRDAIKDLEALGDNERDMAFDRMKDADTPEEKKDVLDDIEDAADEGGGTIPILKYSQEKDPDTGKRTPPLQTCLAAPKKCPDIEVQDADIPQNVINTIIRSIVNQLKKNNINMTEGMVNKVVDVLAERENEQQREKMVDALATALNNKKDIKVRGHGGFWAQKANGELEFFHQMDFGNKIDRAKAAAEAWLRDSVATPEAPVDSEVPSGVPKSWTTQGGTQEEWDVLSRDDQSLFLKMPRNKQSKFFKMSPEQRDDLRKKMQAVDPSKSDIGAGETSASQADAEKAALGRGLEAEEGTIKISTLRAQLATIDPQPDEQTRKAAISIVHQFLAPYLKKHGIRFSEQQEHQLASNILNIITEVNNVK